MTNQPDERGGDPMLSPEEEAMLDAVWDSIDFSDTDDESTDEDVEPATRAIKALDGTKQTWMAFFKTTVREAMSGRLTKPQAYALLSNRLQRSGEDAYRDALRENGITELDELDQAQIEHWNSEQQGYLGGFVDELFSTGLTPEQADSRAEMWSNKSVQASYDLALISVDKNGMYEWALGNTEKHCDTCKRLAGQRHRMREWNARDLLPKSSKLDCGGYQCDCRLEKTTEKAEGRF